MQRTAALFALLLFVSASLPAYALSVNDSAQAFECVKKKIVGDATTYNPYAAGWKTGGTGLATGGRYNPDAWEAAIQLDIGREIGCGVGSGKTCRAIVSAPSTGRAAIVLINDNGPMCADPATYARAAECRQKGKYARVIDLNKQSMYFLSNGKSGNNVGTLYNVEVAILDPKCNQIGQLGPLGTADKDAWAKIAANMPATEYPNQAPSTSIYGNPANPYSPVSISPFSGYGASPSQLGQPSASPYGGNVGAATSPFNVNSPVSALLRGEDNAVVGDRSASTILLQPINARKGSTLLVSWTSVNMKPALCMMRLNDKEFARGNEATQRYVIPDTATTLKFTLECETAAGEKATSAATITL